MANFSPPLAFTFEPSPNGGRTFAQCSNATMYLHSSVDDFSPLNTTIPPYSLTAYTPNYHAYTVDLGTPNLQSDGQQVINWTVITPSTGTVLVSLQDGRAGQGTVETLDVTEQPPSPSFNDTCARIQTALAGQFFSNPSKLTVRANSTTVNACDSLKVDITGGTPPYNLTFLHVGYYLERVQLDPQDVGFVYVNRFEVPPSILANRYVPPKTTLHVYATDSAGNNITSGEIINLALPNSSCPSLPSPGTALKTVQNPDSKGLSRSTTGVIAGVAVGVAVLLAAIVAAWMIWRRRRGTRARKSVLTLDDDSDKGVSPGISDLEGPFAVRPFEQTPSEYARSLEARALDRKGLVTRNANMETEASPELVPAVGPQPPPGNAHVMKASPKPPAEEPHPRMAPESASPLDGFLRDDELDANGQDVDDGAEGSVIVVHHRDAGAVRRRVLDIPPPYGEQLHVIDAADGEQSC